MRSEKEIINKINSLKQYAKKVWEETLEGAEVDRQIDALQWVLDGNDDLMLDERYIKLISIRDS